MSEKLLRVLSVCTSDAVGGAGRAAYRIHQGVRSLGVDSRMLVKYKQNQGDDVVSLQEIVTHNPLYQALDWVQNKFKNKAEQFRWSRYPEREAVFLSDLRGEAMHGVLQKTNYDVLHLHWINQRFVPLKALPKHIPIVWTLHDSWPFCGICHYALECKGYQQQCGHCPFLHSDKANDLSHRIWKKKAEIYHDLDLHIVSPSRWLADCAKQSSLLGRFPVEVIPNCLDVEQYRPLTEKEMSSRWSDLMHVKSVKRLVLFGAINAANDKIKGLSHLMEALSVLKAQGHANDLELVVFGAERSELKTDLSLPVHCVGYVSDPHEMVSLYNLADVMAVPSLTEVFGQTASEAMACGIPVAAFQCTGIQEVVDHKLNGYLARPYETDDLAAGILWCIENNGDHRLGKAAREKVLNNYAIECVCQQYKDLYNSLMVS